MKSAHLIIAVTIAFFCVSCASRMVPISGTSRPDLQVEVSVGDTVRVLTKHGARPTFEIVEITAEYLAGEDQLVRYDDMAFVEKLVGGRHASTGAGVTALLIIVAGAVVLQDASPGFPSAP